MPRQAEAFPKDDEERALLARIQGNEPLPDLVGSEKQIGWATDIRENAVAALEFFVKPGLDAVADTVSLFPTLPSAAFYSIRRSGTWGSVYPDLTAREIAQALLRLRSKRSAHWWIENRHHLHDLRGLVAVVLEEMSADDLICADPAAALARAETMAESTLRPGGERVRNVEPVEASFPDGKRIRLRNPSFSEDFNGFVKSRKFGWKKPYWTRKAGVSADVFVETCVLLLADGWPVAVFDEELRRRVAEGAYEPEPDLVLEPYACKKRGLQFRFRWRKFGPWVADIRKLPGSHVFDNAALVGARCWEEVLGVASCHGFAAADGVQQVVDLGKSLELGKTVAPAVKEFEHVAAPVGLAWPTGQIDADLLDDDDGLPVAC
jgi:hypothetical protein